MTRDQIKIGNVNIKCFCCGRMIPEQGYTHRVGDEKKLFCGEDCYKFFLEYRKIKKMRGIR